MNKPIYNVLLLANNITIDQAFWDEVHKVRDFYAPRAELKFWAIQSTVDNMRWTKQSVTSTAGNTHDMLPDPSMFNSAFTKRALRWGWQNEIGIDIMVVVFDGRTVPSAVTNGACDWGNSIEGMVECWIKGAKTDIYTKPNSTETYPALGPNLAHELGHAISFYNGVTDYTHEYQLPNRGNHPSSFFLQHVYVTPKYTAKKTAYRYLRNFFRRIWNLF